MVFHKPFDNSGLQTYGWTPNWTQNQHQSYNFKVPHLHENFKQTEFYLKKIIPGVRSHNLKIVLFIDLQEKDNNNILKTVRV